MLRSFAYAAAAASDGKPGERASAWEHAARDAFLIGYFSDHRGVSGLLPRSGDNAQRVLALFEIEKVFYELRYELDHRPDWVRIPLLGISELHA